MVSVIVNTILMTAVCIRQYYHVRNTHQYLVNYAKTYVQYKRILLNNRITKVYISTVCRYKYTAIK